MNFRLRPGRVIHDRPLYGKQFSDMEFGCMPIAAGEIKRFFVSKYEFGWRVWIEVKLVDKMTLEIQKNRRVE